MSLTPHRPADCLDCADDTIAALREELARTRAQLLEARARLEMARSFDTGVEVGGQRVTIAHHVFDMPGPGLPWRLFDEDGYALDSAGCWTVAIEAAGYPTADAAFAALAAARKETT